MSSRVAAGWVLAAAVPSAARVAGIRCRGFAESMRLVERLTRTSAGTLAAPTAMKRGDAKAVIIEREQNNQARSRLRFPSSATSRPRPGWPRASPRSSRRPCRPLRQGRRGRLWCRCTDRPSGSICDRPVRQGPGQRSSCYASRRPGNRHCARPRLCGIPPLGVFAADVGRRIWPGIAVDFGHFLHALRRPFPIPVPVVDLTCRGTAIPDAVGWMVDCRRDDRCRSGFRAWHVVADRAAHEQGSSPPVRRHCTSARRNLSAGRGVTMTGRWTLHMRLPYGGCNLTAGACQ